MTDPGVQVDGKQNFDRGREAGVTDKAFQATVAAWNLLVRGARVVIGRVETDLKTAGLPPLEWYDVLFELSRAPEGWLNQAELERRLLLAQYNLSRLLQRIERDGLVVRQTCPIDARQSVVRITDAGQALRVKMWRGYRKAIQAHVGAHLTQQDAKKLAGLLRKLLQEIAPAEPATSSSQCANSLLRTQTP
jgi:DNA-binding MarR family transcriptional regulator